MRYSCCCVMALVLFITFDLSNTQNFGITKRRPHSQRFTFVSTVLSETGSLTNVKFAIILLNRERKNSTGKMLNILYRVIFRI